MITNHRRNTAELNRQMRELNGIIHSRNLYLGNSRFIDARVERGVLTIANLYTEERIPYVRGVFRDGNGNPVELCN